MSQSFPLNSWGKLYWETHWESISLLHFIQPLVLEKAPGLQYFSPVLLSHKPIFSTQFMSEILLRDSSRVSLSLSSASSSLVHLKSTWAKIFVSFFALHTHDPIQFLSPLGRMFLVKKDFIRFEIWTLLGQIFKDIENSIVVELQVNFNQKCLDLKPNLVLLLPKQIAIGNIRLNTIYLSCQKGSKANWVELCDSTTLTDLTSWKAWSPRTLEAPSKTFRMWFWFENRKGALA